METERIAEILKELKKQRTNKIFVIIKDFTDHGGKTENCTVDWWGKNPDYPELYRLECQIDRYERMISIA